MGTLLWIVLAAVALLAVYFAIHALVGSRMQALESSMHNSLAVATAEVSTRLDSMSRQVNERLQENAKAMRSGAQEVNARIAGVQSTFAGLQNQVGEITGQARQIAELARSMAQLEHVLRSPKLRGGFGETQLESLLLDVFPREQFATHHRFSSGEIVDAIVRLPQGLVAIDSKFSLENFRRIATTSSELEAKGARREFLKDLKKRIDEIASKYIQPAEGTLPFALMYIPAENVYYEAIIRNDDGDDLYEYCAERRVLPVSPNSLYAYLQTIMIGLNSLRISQRAEQVLRGIQSLEVELDKFDDLYGKVGGHLKNAARSYEDSIREFERLERRVETLASDQSEQLPLLDEDRRRLESDRAQERLPPKN